MEFMLGMAAGSLLLVWWLACGLAVVWLAKKILEVMDLL